MPQATPELRAEWGISETKAMEYLKSRGFELRKDYNWRAPVHMTNILELNEKDHSAIVFLMQEWDFGTGVHFDLAV